MRGFIGCSQTLSTNMVDYLRLYLFIYLFFINFKALLIVKECVQLYRDQHILIQSPYALARDYEFE